MVEQIVYFQAIQALVRIIYKSQVSHFDYG